MMLGCDVGGIEKIFHAKQLLAAVHAGIGEHGCAGFFVNCVMFRLKFADNIVNRAPTDSSLAPEIISGVRASSTRMESTSSTMA